MQDTPDMTWQEAYVEVVIPKMAAQRDTVRQEVLAELNQRPHSTSVTSSTAQKADAAPSEDIEDVIRQAIRGQ